MQARFAVAGVSEEWLPDGADILAAQALGVGATTGHTTGAVSCANWTTRTAMAATRVNTIPNLLEYRSAAQGEGCYRSTPPGVLGCHSRTVGVNWRGGHRTAL